MSIFIAVVKIALDTSFVAKFVDAHPPRRKESLIGATCSDSNPVWAEPESARFQVFEILLSRAGTLLPLGLTPRFLELQCEVPGSLKSDQSMLFFICSKESLRMDRCPFLISIRARVVTDFNILLVHEDEVLRLTTNRLSYVTLVSFDFQLHQAIP